MKFSMDLASNTVLIGPVNGTLRRGASVIPGVTGTAFYTGPGGGYLDLGVHSGEGCLHYPDDCPNGISFALWLKIYELPAPDKMVVILHNGGCIRHSAGYCLSLRYNDIGFTARHKLPGSLQKIAILPLHQWYHITISYKDTQTAIFVNGCPGETTYKRKWERNGTITQIRRFTFGNMERGASLAHVALDEVVIWYTALSADDTWQVYVKEATE